MTKKQPRSVLKSTLMLILSALMLQLLGFIYRMVLSRMLTAELMGVYGLMMPVYSFLSAVALSGFTVAASRTTAHFAGTQTERLHWAAQVLKTSLKVYFPIFLLTVIIFSAVSGSVAGMLGKRELQTALLLLLPCLLMTSLENVIKSVFQGLNDVVPSMISECSEQLIRIVSVWVFLKYVRGSAGRVCAAIVCGMIVSEVASDIILTTFGKTLFAIPTTQESTLPGQILHSALPVNAANACGMLLSAISGAIVPVALQKYGYTPSAALAQYGELSGILLPLLSIPGAFVYPIYTVMLPKITGVIAAGRLKEVRQKSIQTMVAGAAMGCCMEGAAVVCAPKLAQICFHTVCPAGSGSLLLLGIGMFFGFATSGAVCVLNAKGKQWLIAAIGIICGIIELPVLYIAIATHGINGYAWVGLILSGIQFVVLLTFAMKKR